MTKIVPTCRSVEFTKELLADIRLRIPGHPSPSPHPDVALAGEILERPILGQTTDGGSQDQDRGAQPSRDAGPHVGKRDRIDHGTAIEPALCSRIVAQTSRSQLLGAPGEGRKLHPLPRWPRERWQEHAHPAEAH